MVTLTRFTVRTINVLLFSKTFVIRTITWAVILLHSGIFSPISLEFVQLAAREWNVRPKDVQVYVDKTNLIRDHVLWGFSCSQLLFALCSSNPFSGNRRLYNFAGMNRRLWTFTELLFMTTLNSGLSRQVFCSSFCPGGLACNFSGPQALETLRPKRLSCPTE